MARHRSPGSRQRHQQAASPQQSARIRAIKVGLVAIAAGAMLVAGNALIAGGRFGSTEPDSNGGENAALAAPSPAAPPPLPAPEVPAPTTKPQPPAPKTSQATPDDGAAALASCTTRVSSASGLTQALSSAKAGQKICAIGSLPGSRLSISRGGSPGAPLQVIGDGSTVVKGITVAANNVVVSGFRVVGAQAPGISLKGSNITASNNTVKHPTGGDYDGLRFFGSNIKILNNTITDISPDGSGAHADCMQTFATDSSSPASQNVTISGNKCQRIDNQCLIAEGPNSSAGDGSGNGVSSHINFLNNVCEVGASQALEIDDVQNVRVAGNTILGKPDKAFSFQNKSINAIVTANKLAAGIGYQVGMDSSSKTGYSGPDVGGGP